MLKNNKGVTLATVILIVVVIVLIASVSIINGTRTIKDAKDSQKKQELVAVKAAVSRETAKDNMSGVITPANNSHPGIKNPVVDRDTDGNPIYAGEEWYLLAENDLEKLGIKGAKNNYLVNYESGLAYTPDDFLENTITVTFNTNGGELSSAGKRVFYGETYGKLPTPTREGYIFKGWNGKNKFNKAKYLNKTTDFVQSNTNKDYKMARIYLSPNTSYFVSVERYNNFDGKNNSYLLISPSEFINNLWTAIAHPEWPNTSRTNFRYTTSGSGILFIGLTYTCNQSNLDTIWANTDVQIEEGTVATEYEPYFVTSDVKVTQQKDHTLTAIWEEE